MKSYKPAAPFTVAMKLLIPTDTKPDGTVTKTFPKPEDVSDDFLFFGSFRTFGGTENTKNDIFTIIDTAVIETWYRPDIKGNCEIYICETGEIYELLQNPEDIQMRHQYMKFKVQKVGGKT